MSPPPYPTTLGGQFRRHAWAYALGALLLGAQQSLMYMRDRFFKAGVDAAVAGDRGEALATAASAMAVIAGAGVVRVLSRVIVFNGGRRAEYELRAALLARLHTLGAGFFRTIPTGDIMSRATNDLTQVRLLLGFGVLNVINTVFALASALTLMFGLSARLTFAALSAAPVAVLCTRWFSRSMFAKTRDNQAALGKMGDHVQASLAGVRVVRSLSLEASEVERFERTNADYLRKSLSLARLRGMMVPVFGLTASLSMMIVFWYGGHLVLERRLTAGEFVAFWTATGRLLWPVIALGFVASIVQRGRASYERLKAIFEAEPEVVDGPLPPREIEGALEVRGLTVELGGRKVLDGVGFSVPAGGSLAIVGRTGSGKSTLAALLPRLLPTPRGAVFLDGQDVCDLPVRTVRHAVGYAQQDAFLFSTTVAKNVGLSLDECESDRAMAEVRAAAREAQIEAEVDGLPQGFDTVVGERGVQLSGGQRQRVALARAFLWRPKVLVLDDPLSAVDARTEAAILEAIARQAERRTLLLITHRVAAASQCDKVLVLEGGRVSEEGTHDELLRRGGLYATFAEEQRRAQDKAPHNGLEPAALRTMATRPKPGVEKRAPSRSEQALRAFHEEDEIKKTYDARLALRLWPFVRPQGHLLGAFLASTCVLAGLTVLRPLVMRHGLDAAVGGGASAGAEFLNAGLGLLGLVALEQGFIFAQTMSLQTAGARAMAALRLHVFRFLHDRRVGFFDDQPVGRLVTRVTNDADAIGEAFASGALNAFGDVLRLAGIVTLMLALDPKLALIAFAALPPVGLLVNAVRRRARLAFREIRTKTARLNAFLNEQVIGMSVTQAYAREEAAQAEFDAINVGYRDANFRSIALESILDAAVEVVSSVCVAAVIWYAGYAGSGDHRVSFGTLVAFIAYLEQFFTPIRDLSTRYTQIQSSLAGAERVFQLLDNRDEDAPPREGPAPNGDEGLAFEFDRVEFSYKPDAPTLRGLTLAVRPGERIALVGPTGSGKTTVASLLLRLYDVQKGSVRVFGRDVTALGREELRRKFSVVPQDVFLFPGTVADNVALGDRDVDLARVERALETIGALDLFARREGGLLAPVDERGQNFSAGERQLLAFARAVYRDAPVLVLDEATASVDSDTEARLQKALERLLSGRTALIIAHRLSTIRSVDRVVVLQKGEVIEQGAPDELAKRDGLYARMLALQEAQPAAAETPADAPAESHAEAPAG